VHPVKVYDTMSRRKIELLPKEAGDFRMFVCGPTVYDFAHLGHAKTYTHFDFIARYLRYRGFPVFYLQNITDIDDKIIRRAEESGLTVHELAEKFTRAYVEDMTALKNTSVTLYAPATNYIDEIVAQIQQLMLRGFAYRTSDGIYFDIARFPGYGRLSGRQTLSEDSQISRIAVNEEKRSPGDFVLWKHRRESEPYWETSLGEGRPGWHIEDTAITSALFGSQYELHGGAIDLIFPHHEAEIAQSEAAWGVAPMVKYWMHAGFLNVNEEKMSKSMGNFLTIRDALQVASASAIRFWIISQHYRSSLELTPQWKDHAVGGLARLNAFASSIDGQLDDSQFSDDIETLRIAMLEALDDDFDTPKAFAHLFEFIRSSRRKGVPGRRTLEFLVEFNALFDFLQVEVRPQEEIGSEVADLIRLRNELRGNRKFDEADRIRDELLARGIVLEDTKSGSTWRREAPDPAATPNR
jgi:cysteinyl-tRNA synthetase